MDKKMFNKADELTRKQLLTAMAASSLSLTFNEEIFGKSKPFTIIRRPKEQPTNHSKKAKSLIFIFAGGGMSHVDTFDIKEANKEANRGASPIKTNADGIRVGKFFPNMAKQMDKFTLINSMQHTQGTHTFGQYLMRTAYSKNSTITHPTMGAWISKFLERRSNDIPPYVSIGKGAGNGFLPGEFGSLPISLANEGVKNIKMPVGLSKERYEKRFDFAMAMNQQFDKKFSTTMTKDYHKVYQDAVKLMHSKDLEVFDLTKEPKNVKETYGTHKFGTSCLLARRLVEAGINCVSLNIPGWDDHGGIYEHFESRCQPLDQGLAALVDDLNSRGLLDTTLIALVSEFGRDSKINGQGGRGHNPRGYTSLLAGGGVKGGQKYGKTDAMGQKAVENIVTPGDFHSTIAYAMGMPTDQVVMSPTGRPFTIGNKGKPITSIF